MDLRGRRFLVTRAREQAGMLCERIRALGGIPIEYATIAIEPPSDTTALDDLLQRVAQFDWVIFTSANGVRAVAARLDALGLTPRIFCSVNIGAIGPATAQAVLKLGLLVDFVPRSFLGERLAAELPVQAGQRVLLLRADIATETLAEVLRGRGVQVINAIAYRTVTPDRPHQSALAADAVVFTSASTVRNFVAMFNGNGRETFSRLDVFCIGPVTAETALTLGLPVHAIASDHTVDGLLAAIVSYYEAKGWVET